MQKLKNKDAQRTPARCIKGYTTNTLKDTSKTLNGKMKHKINIGYEIG